MTIQNTTRKAGPFAGNAIVTMFPFVFAIFDKTNIKVVLVDQNGASSTLTLDSDYSVTVNANQASSPGGSISYPISGNPLPAGYQLVILGALAYTQPTDITNSGGFYPDIIETMSDRSTIQIQQLAEISSRTIVLNESETASPVLPDAAGRANTVIGFDDNGTMIVIPVPAAVGAGDLHDDIFNAGVDFVAGTTTVFNLSRAPGSSANVFAYWDGVPQFGFGVAGAAATFSSAPPIGVSQVRIRTGTTLSVFAPSSLAAVGGGNFSPAINLAHNPSNMSLWTANGTQNFEGFSVDIGNYGPREFGAFGLVQAIAGMVNIPATSVLYGHSVGTAGYARSASTTTGAVPLFGWGESAANGALAWGLNTVTKDNGFATTVWGYEVDINVDNVNTIVLGVDITGGSSVEPALSIGLRIAPINAFTGNKWQKGILVNDGSSYTGIEVGAANASTNSASLPQRFYFFDTSNLRQATGRFQADAGGNFTVGNDYNNGLLVLNTVVANVIKPQLSLGNGWSFNGAAPSPTAAITGSKGGNAALAALITYLANKGVVIDSTT